MKPEKYQYLEFLFRNREKWLKNFKSLAILVIKIKISFIDNENLEISEIQP